MPQYWKGLIESLFLSSTGTGLLWETPWGENSQGGLPVTSATYRDSIYDSTLKHFVTFGWVDYASLNELIEKKIKISVPLKSRTAKPWAVKSWKSGYTCIHGHQGATTRRFCSQLVHSYNKVLEAAGMQELPVERPYVQISTILRRVKPGHLHQRMKKPIKWSRENISTGTNFRAFVRELAV